MSLAAGDSNLHQSFPKKTHPYRHRGSLMLGKYKETRCEHFEEYFKKMRINYLARKVLKRATTFLHVSVDPSAEDDDDTPEEDIIWHIVGQVYIPFKGTIIDPISFKHGASFDYTFPRSDRRAEGRGDLDFERNVITITFEYVDDVVVNKFEFDENGCILNVTHRDGTKAWKYLERVQDK